MEGWGRRHGGVGKETWRGGGGDMEGWGGEFKIKKLAWRGNETKGHAQDFKFVYTNGQVV